MKCSPETSNEPTRRLARESKRGWTPLGRGSRSHDRAYVAGFHRGNIRVVLAALIAGVLLVALIGFWWVRDRGETPPEIVNAAKPEPASSAIIEPVIESQPRYSHEDLTTMRTRLLALPRDAASAEIRAWLTHGKDAPTGLGFELAAGNQLTGWPTLRVFLIDLLLEIDPASAAAASREILATPTTADEWAVALRNLARADASATARDELRMKTEELIRNPAWQENPSIGYLNAFDVLAHTRAVESAPLLSELIQRKDRRDLAHAGFLTLDRLVQSEPVAMLATLARDTALHASRPEMVAQQMARADLRDETQRALVRSWLLDAARTPIELTTFAESYPNHNQMVSHNLLTEANPVSGQSLAGHDQAAAAILAGWTDDPDFASLRTTLEMMSARIAEFIPQTLEP